jgi:hypothetical protein
MPNPFEIRIFRFPPNGFVFHRVGPQILWERRTGAEHDRPLES